MSANLHLEVSEELLEQLRKKYNAPTEEAVLSALNSVVRPMSKPPEIPLPNPDIPGMEAYPLDPTINSQKDLIQFLGTFENFMTLDDLMEMRWARSRGRSDE